MRREYLLVAAVMLAAPCAAAAAAAGAAGALFDTPIATEVVKLSADPANPGAKAKRTCNFYPGYMVKEVDLGEVGADELAIAPVPDGGRRPACAARTAGERIINPHDWSGYFAGAKGPFVFFDAEDGHNGGMPFAVYDASAGRKLFEDSRAGSFISIKLVGRGLVLRYRRVFDAGCSLYAGRGCWEKIRAATKLADKPDCTAAYDKEKKRTPQFAGDVPGVSTVVSYSVEVTYAGGKFTTVPQMGSITCWLED
ncbi:MAG: hypothetical protein KGJ78_10810 [Alphaproteobacteria bacterium]|nr:hypothetical protein [Alphaproteobacteria bacterium]